MPLSESVPTVTAALAAQGYRTFAAGKLHLQPGLDGGERPALPVFSWEDQQRWASGEIRGLPAGYYGFQETAYVNGHVAGCYGDYVNDVCERDPAILEAYQREQGRRCPGNLICWRTAVPAEQHYNHWLTDRSIDYLSRDDERPFFAWCSFPDPHGPWAAAAGYTDAFDPAQLQLPPHWQDTDDPLPLLRDVRAKLPGFLRVDDAATLAEVTAQTLAMQAHIDDNIGRLLQALTDHGLDDNTIVVVISDHGEYLGAHGLLGKTPWPYEELLRIPMIWSLPTRFGEQAAQLDIPVSQLDLVPSILDFAGLDATALLEPGRDRADWRLPGDSLRPWLQGEPPPPDRDVLMEFDNGMKPGAPIRSRTLIRKRYKLTLFDGEAEGLLYDLQADPLEQHNRWHDLPEVRAELTDALLRRLIATDPLPLPRFIGA